MQIAIFFALYANFRVVFCESPVFPSCGFKSSAEAMQNLTGNDYDRFEVPKTETGKPRYEVETRLIFVNFVQVDESEGSVEALLVLERNWADTRFERECLFSDEPYGALEVFDSDLAKLWTPKIEIINLIDAKKIAAPASQTYALIYPDGTVSRIDTLLVKKVCNTNYRFFPFDAMICNFMLTRWGLWAKNNPVVIQTHFTTLPTHEVTSYKLINTTSGVPGHDAKFPTASILLRRHYTQYVLLAFVPNSITVLVAGLSFFVDPSAAAPRVSLGLSSLMALVIQYGNIVKSVPKVGYLKSFDVWMLICLTLISLTLVQFAYVNRLLRLSPPPKGRIKNLDEKGKAFYFALFVVFLAAFFVTHLLKT